MTLTIEEHRNLPFGVPGLNRSIFDERDVWNRIMDHRVQKIISLMQEKMGSELSLSDLARVVNLSPSRLHELFKSTTGMPPAKYLRLLRMQQARELLENTFLSVKEIRVRVGFGDESHFVRDFRKVYGISPAQYRQEYLRAHLAREAPPQAQEQTRTAASEIACEDGPYIEAHHLLNVLGSGYAAQMGLLGRLSRGLRRHFADMYVAAVEVRHFLSHAIIIAHRTLRPRPPRRPSLHLTRMLKHSFPPAQRYHFITIRRPSPPKQKRLVKQPSYKYAALQSCATTTRWPSV